MFFGWIFFKDDFFPFKFLQEAHSAEGTFFMYNKLPQFWPLSFYDISITVNTCLLLTVTRYCLFSFLLVECNLSFHKSFLSAGHFKQVAEISCQSFGTFSLFMLLFNSLERLFLELRYCLMEFTRFCSLHLWKDFFFFTLLWITCCQNVPMAVGVNIGGFTASTRPENACW